MQRRGFTVTMITLNTQLAFMPQKTSTQVYGVPAKHKNQGTQTTPPPTVDQTCQSPFPPLHIDVAETISEIDDKIDELIKNSAKPRLENWATQTQSRLTSDRLEILERQNQILLRRS